jgi:hypothetical protein
MDHKYIEQFDLVDRYLMGRLAAEESARFEEHFVDCSQCTDRLAVTRDFIQDLRFVTARQASHTDSYGPRRSVWYLSQLFSHKPLALTAGILLVALTAGAFLVVNQMRRLRYEADQAKSLSAQWERRYEEERQSSAASALERQETEQQRTEQLHDLEERLQRAQRERAGTAEPGGPTGSGVNLPILVLSSVRGGQPESSESINKITLPRSPVNFAITLSLEGEATCKDYRLIILDARDRPVWKRAGFKPDRYNTLWVFFNSVFFRPGNYLLTVECLTAEGGSRPVGNYPFRISKDLR